jgi:hypothetical protein
LFSVLGMGTPRDYYRILHVQPDAPTAIVHASYRTLLERARRGADARAERALLDEAYAVLGDPARRAAYDQARAGTGSQTASVRVPIVDSLDDTGIRSAICLFCGTPHGLKRTPDREDECGRCASPLCTAERHRLEYSGQRMLARVPKQRAAEVRVTWPQATPLMVEMRDLSLNGMRFVAPAALELNQIVRVDCPELRALGRVAHLKRDQALPERWLTGIEFLTLRFWQVRGSFVSAEV